MFNSLSSETDVFTNRSFKQSVERSRLCHYVTRHRTDLEAHMVRVQYEKKEGTVPQLCGAVADYFIACQYAERPARYRLLLEVFDRLSNEWLLTLHDGLDEGLTPISPLPDSEWSLLTEDVQGHFSYL